MKLLFLFCQKYTIVQSYKNYLSKDSMLRIYWFGTITVFFFIPSDTIWYNGWTEICLTYYKQGPYRVLCSCVLEWILIAIMLELKNLRCIFHLPPPILYHPRSLILTRWSNRYIRVILKKDRRRLIFKANDYDVVLPFSMIKNTSCLCTCL